MMEFLPDRFSNLHEFLETTLSNPTIEGVGRVRLELDKARPHFVSLLDRKPRSPREEANLKQTGRVRYAGVDLLGGPDWVLEVLHLSQQLEMSENACAALLQHAMTQKVRYQRQDAETAAICFYKEQDAMLTCLERIFDQVVGEGEEMHAATGLSVVLEMFAKSLVDADVQVGTGSGAKGKWVDKLLKELDTTKGSASKLKAILTGQRPPAGTWGAPPTFGLNNHSTPASAGTATQPTARFSDDVIQFMLQQTQTQRRRLAQLLSTIARRGFLGKPQITALATLLSDMDGTDTVIVHVMIAVLAALDWDSDTQDYEDESTPRTALLSDAGFLISMRELVHSKKWKLKGVQAVVNIQWGMFMQAAYQRDPDLEPQLQIWADDVEAMIVDGITHGAFAFLAYDVLSFNQGDDILDERRHHRRALSVLSEDAQRTASPDELLGIELDFRDRVIGQVDQFLIAFISSQQSLLRKLRHREEDALGAYHAALYRPLNYSSYSPSSHAPPPPIPPRSDVSDLFAAVAAAHRGKKDSGLPFWGVASDDLSSGGEDDLNIQQVGRLAYFLRWAAECRIDEMIPSVYAMLTSLATGPRAADKAYEFFLVSATETDPSPAPCSWVHLFKALHHYVPHLAQDPMGGEIAPEDLRHLRAYTKFLCQVVLSSSVARVTLVNHQRYKPVQTLFELVTRRLMLDFKADLMLTIAAFASPGDATSAVIAQNCWLQLEQCQILSTMPMAAPNTFALAASPGMPHRTDLVGELEDVEAPNRRYPQSTAFVQLLATLVHPATRSSPLRSGAELELQSIPDNLGGGYRAPGIEPYIQFVVEDMMQKSAQREYANPNDAYVIFEACLSFLERCLLGYDLSPLLAVGAVGSKNFDRSVELAMRRAVAHPGFDIMLRILSSTELTRHLLEIVVHGHEHLDPSAAADSAASRCILRSLRILHRVAELQTPFLEVLLPKLEEKRQTQAAPIEYLPQQQQLAVRVESLDHHLFLANEAALAIALLIGCQTDEEIAYLSVQLISFVAESRTFSAMDAFYGGKRSARLNRLLALVADSEDSDVIISHVLSKLEAAALAVPDTTDDDFVVDASQDLDSRSMSGFAAAGRYAILDMLLLNTQPTRPAPNLAHLLLGFDIRATPEKQVLDNPQAPTRLACVHTILALLDRYATGDFEDATPLVPLMERDPALAERCYRLVRQLCLHDYTAAAMGRYLRTSQNFFLRQAQYLPIPAPIKGSGTGPGYLTTNEATQPVYCTSVVAALHSTAWVLEAIALELNTLTSEGLREHSEDLVRTLFDTAIAQPDAMSLLDQRGRAEQGRPRMEEVLQSTCWEWSDDMQTQERRLVFFADIDFSQCREVNAAGCEILDISAVLALLSAARRDHQTKGQLTTAAKQDEMKEEVKSLITAVIVHNREAEVAHAKLHALRAWRALLDLTLSRAFSLLPPENSHVLLLDLLADSLPQIASGQAEVATSELLSEVAVSLMARVRYEASHLEHLAPGEETQAFPSDRLLPTLDNLLRGILRCTASGVVRGNLYAAMLTFMHYVNSSSQGSTTFHDGSMVDGGSTVVTTKKNSLEAGCFTQLKVVLGRLLPDICRDASTGPEVWRTVAFTVLDAILLSAYKARYGDQVQSALERDGSLRRFVAMLKEAESSLLDVLDPDPVSLNALFVYEAQVSFLTRVAFTTSGAQKLIDCSLIEVLGQCRYLMPNLRDPGSVLEFDTFMPSAPERHHQLLLPALQLVVAVLTSLGPKSAAASKQAFRFIMFQRDSILAILKNANSGSSLMGLQELQLITVIMHIALAHASEDPAALAPTTGFEALHYAQKEVAARTCANQSWVHKVRPINDAERAETTQKALGTSNSVFMQRSQEWGINLQAAQIGYLRAASDRRPGGPVRTVLLPTMKQSEETTGVLGGVLGISPTLGSTLSLVSESCDALAASLDQAAHLCSTLADWHRLDPADFEDVLPLTRRDSEADWRARARPLLLEAQNKARAKACTLLNIIDGALFLLRRHIAHYLRKDPASGMTGRSGRGGYEQLDPALREDCLAALRPLSNRLSAVKLKDADLDESEVRGRQEYLHLVFRSLSDVLANK